MEVVFKETRLSPEDIFEKAQEYFGTKYGLSQVDKTDCCIEFRSDVGFVNVTVETSETPNKVSIRSREYEGQARAFIKKLD
ncbi:MAG: hypothetical protein BAJATHORv1_20392 [Candidatus Thorarchaeota archaeon]|nr:MAG: hypothetical protein BAJATHORv1_20392 [Candidatus Thorarchaeota archaeon]